MLAIVELPMAGTCTEGPLKWLLLYAFFSISIIHA
jgi:hypothetical protein